MNRDEAEKEALVKFFSARKQGYFVEVGVNEPKDRSQTWPLEQLGWRGLLVEPMRAQYEILLSARPRSRVVCAACVSPEQRGEGRLFLAESSAQNTLQRDLGDHDVHYVGEETVPLVTLDDLLENQPPARIDFVSIDVEGTELDVLRGFNLARWQPELILIEDKVRNLHKHRYLTARGYRLLRRTTLNGWYVRAGHPARASLGERWRLFRKYFLALPSRKFQHWRHTRQKSAKTQPADYP